MAAYVTADMSDGRTDPCQSTCSSHLFLITEDCVAAYVTADMSDGRPDIPDPYTCLYYTLLIAIFKYNVYYTSKLL